MTPKERFFPAVREALAGVLLPEGFKWSRTFFAKELEEVTQFVVPQIIPRAQQGCLDIRLIMSVLSPHMLSVLMPGAKPIWDFGQIDFEASRLVDPRDRRMWTMCTDEDAGMVAGEMRALVTDHVVPFLRTVRSTAEVIAAIRANTSLATARPHITLANLDTYEQSL